MIMVMEQIPTTENVAYLDEYPHLAEKVRLKHLAQPRSIGAQILQFAAGERAFDEIRNLMEEAPC